MQSFFAEKEQHKIISAQKPLENTPLPAMNPFYEYITSKKPLNISFPQEDPKNQRPSSVSIPTQPSISSERKTSTEFSDPRRLYAPHKIQPSQKKTETTQNVPSPKVFRNPQLNEKRSRSRDQKKSKNRQSSSDRFGGEKKEEHFRKTKLCPLYEKGECQKGSSCSFAHGLKDLRCLPNFYKTKLCLAFEKGECKKSVKECKYAHGEKQLRSLKHDAGYSNTIHGLEDKRQRSRNGHKKNKNDRNSESAHRQDKHHKHSHRRQDSTEDKKQKSQRQADPLSYKKNIPLSKDYEKFLYGDLNSQSSAVQNNPFVDHKDSMHMVPNSSITSGIPLYSKDAYSINFGKHFQSVGPQQGSVFYPPLQRAYMNPSIPFYAPQERPPVSYHEKNPSDGYNQTNYSYLNQKQLFSSEKVRYSEISYPPVPANQGYNKVQPVDLYPKNNQGGFWEQPYPNFYLKDGCLSDSLPYVPSYGALPSEYPQKSKNVDRSESFYKRDSFYSDGSQQSFKGLSYHQNGFEKSQVYDLYPAIDKGSNQVRTNPTYNFAVSQQKNRYSGFSNSDKK